MEQLQLGCSDSTQNKKNQQKVRLVHYSKYPKLALIGIGQVISTLFIFKKNIGQ